jgi:hypothetical protein
LISTAKVHNVKQRAVASMFRAIRIRRVKLAIIGCIKFLLPPCPNKNATINATIDIADITRA